MKVPLGYHLIFGIAAALLIAPPSTGFAQARLAQRILNRNHANGPVQSQNFIVYANDRALAARVSQAAEGFRKSLAHEWLGRELPVWPQKCPIRVSVGPHAGGETSFAFQINGGNRSQPLDWDMKIYGPPDRLLDAVLPHEITHAIFATHFGRPLPRWADEGACTTVEHVSEQSKNHQMLLQFLTTSRGIPFNRMFTLKEYPDDILPLYAQGFSVAKFLIFQKGKRHFLNFVDRGMQYEDFGNPIAGWNRATREFYSFDNLSDLQLAWVGWVRQGSDRDAAAKLGGSSQTSQLAQTTPPVDQTFASRNRSNSDSSNRRQDIAGLSEFYASQSTGRPPADGGLLQARATLPSEQPDGRIRSLLEPLQPATQQSATGTFAGRPDSWYLSQVQPRQRTETAANNARAYQLKKITPTVDGQPVAAPDDRDAKRADGPAWRWTGDERTWR